MTAPGLRFGRNHDKQAPGTSPRPHKPHAPPTTGNETGTAAILGLRASLSHPPEPPPSAPSTTRFSPVTIVTRTSTPSAPHRCLSPTSHYPKRLGVLSTRIRVLSTPNNRTGRPADPGRSRCVPRRGLRARGLKALAAGAAVCGPVHEGVAADRGGAAGARLAFPAICVQ
jgi:hypothetical protein